MNLNPVLNARQASGTSCSWKFSRKTKALAVGVVCLSACLICYGEEPKLAKADDEIVLPEHQECTLEVVRISAPIDSELVSEEAVFHREVVLLLKNGSKDPITLSGYGSDEDPMILDRFQVWDPVRKMWPALKVQRVCGTGLRTFTLPPEGRLQFTTTMSAKPEGEEFRFGVTLLDRKHPEGASVFSKASQLPSGGKDGADPAAIPSVPKPDGVEKPEP